MPQQFKELTTPFRCFNYFFNDDLQNEIVYQSNLYAKQQDVSTKFTLTSCDLKKYIGILIYMSVYRYSSVESYWSKHSFESVRNAMTFKQLFSIRKYLHFNDTNKMKKPQEAGFDELYKIRPLIDRLNMKFDSVPKPARLQCVQQKC